MPISLDGVFLETLSLVTLLFALVLSAVILSRYSSRVNPVTLLRERFVYGIPWGTAIVIAAVYVVYYFVQGGGEDGGPIMTAFRSWSLWYPQGTLFSSFAHASSSHLQGNVLGAIVFAPIVEYVWGHYPEPMSDSSSKGKEETRTLYGLLTHPAGRIGFFVAAVVVVGILGSLLVPGAVIGFSGLVFAFAGFALVSKPLVTVVAILGLQVLRLVVRAFESPTVTATARPRFVTPSWADVALQGHLFGVLIGALLAVALLRMRNQQPELQYVWFAALVFAVTRSLDAVYWYLGANQYILFRAVGTAGVFILAVAIALAAAGPEQSQHSRWKRLPAVQPVAIGLLIVSLLALSVGGVAYSLSPVSPGEEIETVPEDQLEVGDYTITYAEGVEDRYIGSVSVPPIWVPSVTVSGVIIASDDRNAWELAVSANQLAFDGRATIPVGDATWRELVYIDRTAWSFTEGNSTAKVFGRTASDESWTLLHRDSPAEGDMTVNGANLSIEPADDFYTLVVERDGEQLGSERLPTTNETLSIDGVEYERIDNNLLVRHEGTEFTVAKFQTRER